MNALDVNIIPKYKQASSDPANRAGLMSLNVRDHGVTMTMSFPKIFKAGLIALWISICFQVLSVFVVSSVSFFGSDLLFNTLIALPSVFLAFLAHRTSAGKNWARVTFLILFLVLILPSGLIKSIPFVFGLVNGQLSSIDWHYQFASALITIALLLQAFSLFVFFSKPSALCFRQSKS